MEYDKENYTNMLVYLSFLVFFVLVLLFSPKHTFRIYDTTPEVIGGWTYNIEQENLVATVKHEIKDSMKGKTIEFFTADNYVDAYIGNKHIYHFGEKNNLGKTPGNYWHFINIPKDAESDLTILIKPAYKSAYCSKYKFSIGEKSTIAYDILNKHKMGIVLSLLILAFGVILCLMHFIEKANKVCHDETLYLALLSIMFSVWSISKMFCMQMILKNTLIPYYMYYAALICMSITIIAYVEKLSPEIHASKEHSLLLCVIAIISILHLFKICDFAETIKGYIAIVTGIMLICIRKIIMNYQNISGIIKKITISVLFILYLFASIGFILNLNIDRAVELSSYGIIILICSNIYDSTIRMTSAVAKTKEMEVMREMAYKDNLTKAFNRNALEHDTEGIGLENLIVISFDLNNLKYYNDTFGHTYGDELILKGSSIIREVYGRVYRTGGDEFLCLVKNKTKKEVQKMHKDLKEKIKIYNCKQPDIILEIACGYAFYEEGDTSYEDILKRADMMMYEDKKRIKSKSKISFVRKMQPN